MTELSLAVPAELLERLRAIAEQKESSVEESALEALAEYADSWDDFNRSVEHMESGKEERTVLRAAHE